MPNSKIFLRWLKEEGVGEYLPEPGTGPNAVDRSLRSITPVSSAGFEDEIAALSWDALQEKALKCPRCPELVKTRQNVVFGAGNVKAQLMFVGEAPGHDEDVQGLPFVGAAGQLLTKIIQSIGFERDQVYIANVLKCRPPQNRPPKPDEITHCKPYLERQIELIKPRILCALGTFAAQTLLKTDTPISKLRGDFRDYPGNSQVKVLCTYHPAYLLRNPAEKRKVWEDMKKIKRELDGAS